MNEGQQPREVASLLRQLRQRCLGRWVERLRATRFGGLPDEVLLNHQAAVYESVELILERGDGDLSPLEAPASAHAENRYQLGYELGELLLEKSWFRTILLEEITAAGARDVAELTLLHRALDQTQVLSAQVFSALRDEEMRRVQRKAEEAHLQFQEALTAMTDGFFQIDRAFRFVFVNPAGERMLGKPLAALRDRTVWEAIPGSENTHIGRLYQQAMVDQQPFETTTLFEPWNRTFEVRAFPGASGISVYFRDISDRLARERERQRTLEALERGDAVFITDADWRIVYVNATQERLTRRPREESLGKILWEAYADATGPSSRYWREYRRVVEERVEVAFDEYYPPTGIWTGVTAYPTREGGMVAFFRDVTERKKAEQLQQRLIGVVGHDLRNPLTAVRLGIHRAAALEGLPEKARISLDRALRSVDRMERLIRDLLDYSSAEFGSGVGLDRRPGDLHQLLESTGEEFAVSHPGRVRFDTEGDLRGAWDADRLGQVLTNLITNGIRHGDPAAPVTVTARGETDAVRITVHNEGSPIPQERMARLFRPFETGSGASGGVGLGLYIARHIVERHGGTIEARSSADDGSTFTIVLPRA